ncbi:MAG: hypothetical protein PHV30_00305 [Candidatus Margulisbacteria bacterium]|nr:hypothetical protein [Candidatus Margulisiibacteriota bacterium]
MTNLPQVVSNIPPSVQWLIDTICNEIEHGKKLTYWNIGKHIKEHNTFKKGCQNLTISEEKKHTKIDLKDI